MSEQVGEFEHPEHESKSRGRWWIVLARDTVALGGASLEILEKTVRSVPRVPSLLLHLKRDVTKLFSQESQSIPYRFFNSHHVQDLSLIFIIVSVLVVLLGVFSGIYLKQVACGADGCSSLGWGAVFLAHIGSIFTTAGSVLAGWGVVAAWTYQAANRRLGVVDLFASEIASLCNVMATFDAGRQFVSLYAHLDEVTDQTRFVSEENYFTVFQGNASDLEVLDGKAVVHVTAFYTYMKSFRDTLRRFGRTHKGGDNPKDDSRHQALRNAMYCLFLSLESARKAIHLLVEFPPRRADHLAAILLTELVCFNFLDKEFADDFKHLRLDQRRADYAKEVGRLLNHIDRGKTEDWARARSLRDELSKRWNEIQIKAALTAEKA